MTNRNCLMCGCERLATPDGQERGPYCQTCWSGIFNDLIVDYLMERIAGEGGNVEHLRANPPKIAELMQTFINLWEVKHTFRNGEVVKA